jgi:dihydroorotase
VRETFDGLPERSLYSGEYLDEGLGGENPNKTYGGSAVSRAATDREAVFFCGEFAQMSVNLLLRGGTVVDPGSGLEGRADLRVSGGLIAAVGRLAPEPGEAIIDVDGLIVAPGLIDVHVHLREPGQEWKETLATGTAAAAAGGFATVFCMPNTDPPLDSVVMLEELQRRVARDAVVRVRQIATISEGRRGVRSADYAALAAAGAIGFSDDGESTRSSAVMREALLATRALGIPVMVHCEDPDLTGGAMHDGDISRQLGIRGIPAQAEEIIIDRDLALAELTGGWLHVCHVSTERGAEAIAAARKRGARVTAEVMPHHLAMDDSWIVGSRAPANLISSAEAKAEVADPDTKVNPPLRPASDALALAEMFRRGDVFDIISTDHAPHGRPEKQGRPFEAAAFGFTASEVALPTVLSLVRAGKITLTAAIAAMTSAPARLWGLPGGHLRPGAPADIVVFDPDERWTPHAETLLSRGSNTPLLNSELQGRVKLTLVDGDERYRDCQGT